MADVGFSESGLNFEQKPNPVSTHRNWVMRKLEDYTMARERSIKQETMGFEVGKYLGSQLGFMFQAAFAEEGKYIAETGHMQLATFYPFIASFATVLYTESIKPYFDAKKIQKRIQTYRPLSPAMRERIGKIEIRSPRGKNE